MTGPIKCIAAEGAVPSLYSDGRLKLESGESNLILDEYGAFLAFGAGGIQIFQGKGSSGELINQVKLSPFFNSMMEGYELKITDLSTPTVDTDAANKAYVDGLVGAITAFTADEIQSAWDAVTV